MNHSLESFFHRTILRLGGLSSSLLGVVACSDTNKTVYEPNAVIIVIQEDPNRIVRVNPNSSDTLTILQEAFYSDLQPAPDGSLLLFNRCGSGCSILPGPVYRSSPMGQGLGPQNGPGGLVRWAPNGAQLAWLASDPAGNAIVLTDLAGGDPDTVGRAEQFAWSPTSTSMVITYRPTFADQKIGTIDLLGARERINRSNDPYDDTHPSWSPDGQLIAFFSARPSAPGLYVMNPDGTGQRRLAVGTMFGPAVWSPDGTTLAFLDFPPEEDPRIRIVTTTGVERSLPASLAATTLQFAWSPSGYSALLVARTTTDTTSGMPQVYVISADLRTFFPLPLGIAGGIQSIGWLRVP